MPILLEPKHNQLTTIQPDIYELAERALKELANTDPALHDFRPIKGTDSRCQFEINHPDGTVPLQIIREKEARLGRYRRIPKKIARIVINGTESLEAIMEKIVKAVNRAIHRLRKSMRGEIQRQKTYFDARFRRFDRCCMAH